MTQQAEFKIVIGIEDGAVDRAELAQAIEDAVEFVRQSSGLTQDKDEGYVAWATVTHVGG